MIRFYMALWGGKLLMFINKHIKHEERDDFPGLCAFKFYPDFLRKVSKPKDVFFISGTNGKTTTACFVNDYMNKLGKRTSFNYWGANVHAGFCLNFMRGVNIFNKCRVDASIIEGDEMTSDFSMPRIRPNYVVVTNLSKDSIMRNAHPEYILDHMNEAVRLTVEEFRAASGRSGDADNAVKEPVFILNANDPISSQIGAGTGANIVYYSMTDQGLNPAECLSPDIRICPFCGEDLKYHYKLYRSIGDFYCPKCGFKMPESKYVASNVDLVNRHMDITDGGVTLTYNLPSTTIYYAFNVLAFVALMREYGESREDIRKFLETQKLPDIRMTCKEYNGIKYHAFSAKGQNGSSASVAFEQMARDPESKEIVLCIDEVQDLKHGLEPIDWHYETDYECLNHPSIKKIFCVGHLGLSHKFRLMLAGVPEERIVYVKNPDDLPALVDTEGIQNVFVLIDVDSFSKGTRWRDAIMQAAVDRNTGSAAGSEADGKEAR